MNYGLYLSASGVLTNLYRQDVFANNLANVKTVGFKPDVAMVRQRDPESIESGAPMKLRNRLLDRLGGGVFAGPQHLNLRQGNLTKTGAGMDVALGDPNAFFVTSVPDGVRGAMVERLTRDGRLTIDGRNFLVTASGGHRLVNERGRPVKIEPQSAMPTITETGQVMQGEKMVARLKVVQVAAPEKLLKEGGNLLRYDGAVEELRINPRPNLHTGAVESSGVDPIKALMDVINATKSVTSNGNMIRYHDLLMDRAVNVLGRVQA